jgi:arabinose-5-phosphate isomerase
MEACPGHVVACGMGKAGIIARKIAGSLASTGTPAIFLHPADALHGDMGMVRAGDVALLFSNSGESEEMTRLLPGLRRIGARIVALTGSARSTLAAQSEVALVYGELREACPFGLAPTASTTAMLVLGDALALCLMQRRGFEAGDYAHLHPAGTLGRRALPVEEVMRTGEAVACVGPDAPVAEAILAITRARAGAAAVVDAEDRLLGVFTDGDLRRGLERGPDFLRTPVREAMTADCTRVSEGTRAGEALEEMRARRIGEVPVVDGAGRLLGVVDLKGLLAAL